MLQPFTNVPQPAPDLGTAGLQAAMQQAYQLQQYIYSQHTAILSDMYSRERQQAGAVVVPTAALANDMNFMHQLALVEPRGQGYILTLLGKAVLGLQLHTDIFLSR